MPKKKESDVVVIPKERITVMQDEEVERYLPHDAAEMNAELPATREGCMHLLICNSVSASRFNSLRKWHIGRIISVLDERGEENVMEEASKLTGYKTRELQHSVKLFKDYPDVNAVVKLASAGLEMIQFKQLGAIRNPETRQLIAGQIMDGKLSKDDVEETTKAVVAKEKAAKKAAACESDETDEDKDEEKAAEEAARPNYRSLYARTEELMLQLIKNLQQYEKEHVDMLDWLGDPARVPTEEFDKAMAVFEDKVEKPMERALKELTATAKVLKKKADEQVERGKQADSKA